VLPAADDVAIRAINWDAIFERAAAQQLREGIAEEQAANSSPSLRGMAVPSVISTGMLSSARQRAMDRVSLLAETNAVEYAKSRREDIIALAKMGIENYVAQWEKQIQSEAERRAYAELSAKFKFDQAAHNLNLLKLSVDYYISTWKAKVESELARLQYAQFAFKQEFDQAAINVDSVVKIGGLQVNLYEAVAKLGLDSELARLQYAQFAFKDQFDVAAQNADIAVKLGGLGVQVYETTAKVQLDTLLARLQYAQFEFKQAYDVVALNVDSSVKLAGLGVNLYEAEIKAQLDGALAKLQYAQFAFKQAYDVAVQEVDGALKLAGVAVQAYSEETKAQLDAERIRIAALDQDVKNLISVAVQDADNLVKLAGIGAQSRGDKMRTTAALEGTKMSRSEALARLGLANVEMVNKNALQVALSNEENRYKTADAQARVYTADAQVYGAKAGAYTQMGELAYKINVDPARIEAEYNLKRTELAMTNNIGHLVDLVQVYSQLVNAAMSASDVSLSSGLSFGISGPFKFNPEAGEQVWFPQMIDPDAPGGSI
jgi:hypothetical protein